MKIIKKFVETIEEELEGAKEYAEKYVENKVNNNMQAAARYKEMAYDELKHASYEHEFAVNEIDKLSKVYTPPEKMMEVWEKAHRQYVERAAWVKQMLEM